MIYDIDRAEVPDPEHISPLVLEQLVRRCEGAGTRWDKLRRYYLGRHDILRSGGDGVRVAVNYAKYVVDVTLGYYLGQPVKYDANPVDAAGEVLDLSPLLRCYDRADVSETDHAIGKMTGVMGECLELCYNGTSPRSAVIDPRCGILVRDNTVAHEKLFALIWERRERLDGSFYYFATVYTDRTARDFLREDRHGAAFHPIGQARKHGFDAVPVIAYTNNDERQGDFEQILPLIDAYDALMSDRLTDKRKFVDALLVFFGMQLAEGDEKRLSAEKFIDGAPLDARAEYIQKTFNEKEVQVLADALVREMHKQTMTVDMSDEHFAGNSSGQALRLKLLTMDLLVRNKMRRMERGLRERMALYGGVLERQGVMKSPDVSQVDVVFTPNLPVNEAEIVDTVCRLQGIVDDQTLLGQLWFIRDPAEALENMQIQRKKSERSS